VGVTGPGLSWTLAATCRCLVEDLGLSSDDCWRALALQLVRNHSIEGEHMRLFTVLAVMLVLLIGVPPAHAVSRVYAASATCSNGLTLLLQPGAVPGQSSASNGPPAKDIPPGRPLIRLPLYPGATRSSVSFFYGGLDNFLPNYRKSAVAEFAIPTSYSAVSAWYKLHLRACGFSLADELPLQHPSGHVVAAITARSRDELTVVNITYLPLTRNATAVKYVVEALDLPPRTPDSFLRGPFVQVVLSFHAYSAAPMYRRHVVLSITWPATISRLIESVNRLTRIAGFEMNGGGGGVICSSVTVLTFVRTDGGARRVRVRTIVGQVVVGHTRALDDTGGRVERLIGHILAHRYHAGKLCI